MPNIIRFILIDIVTTLTLMFALLFLQHIGFSQSVSKLYISGCDEEQK